MQHADRVRRAGMIVRAELMKREGEWISIAKLTQIVTLNTGIQKSWVKKQFSEEGIFSEDVEYDELGGMVKWLKKEN